MSKIFLVFVIFIYDSLQQPTSYQYVQSSLTTLSENDSTVVPSTTFNPLDTRQKYTEQQYLYNTPHIIQSIPKYTLFPNGSYEFEYSTADQSRKESSDVNGNVNGRYSYSNKNYVHEVQYVANSKLGFAPVHSYYMIRATRNNDKNKYSAKYQLVENVEPYKVHGKYIVRQEGNLPRLQNQFQFQQQSQQPFQQQQQQIIIAAKPDSQKIFYTENPLESNFEIHDLLNHYNPNVLYTLHI